MMITNVDFIFKIISKLTVTMKTSAVIHLMIVDLQEILIWTDVLVCDILQPIDTRHTKTKITQLWKKWETIYYRLLKQKLKEKKSKK